MGPQPGGCFKELPLYKSAEELAKCKIPDLLAFLEEAKQQEQDMRDDYVQMFGEIEMSGEIEIQRMYELVRANDKNAVVGQYYRDKDSVQPPDGSLEVGHIVHALRCVSIKPANIPQPPYVTPTVEYTLVELMLVANEDEGPPVEGIVLPNEDLASPAEDEDLPSPPADRRYWDRNRVIEESIKQALLTFLYEMNSHNNRVCMARMCTLRVREEYPECRVECSCTPRQMDEDLGFTFTVTEGTLTTHYHAEIDKDTDVVDVRVNITGEENDG